jgi:hypothetical protein
LRVLIVEIRWENSTSSVVRTYSVAKYLPLRSKYYVGGVSKENRTAMYAAFYSKTSGVVRFDSGWVSEE